MKRVVKHSSEESRRCPITLDSQCKEMSEWELISLLEPSNTWRVEIFKLDNSSRLTPTFVPGEVSLVESGTLSLDMWSSPQDYLSALKPRGNRRPRQHQRGDGEHEHRPAPSSGRAARPKPSRSRKHDRQGDGSGSSTSESSSSDVDMDGYLSVDNASSVSGADDSSDASSSSSQVLCLFT